MILITSYIDMFERNEIILAIGSNNGFILTFNFISKVNIFKCVITNLNVFDGLVVWGIDAKALQTYTLLDGIKSVTYNGDVSPLNILFRSRVWVNVDSEPIDI